MKMPTRRWVRTTSVAALAVASLGSAALADDNVVARMGSIELKAQDVRTYVATLDPRVQSAILQNPALAGQAVRLLLAQEMALKEAQAQKWDQQPAVAAQLQRIRESAIMELYLQSVTVPPASYPAEADVQSAYDANQRAFLVPRQYELAQIYVATTGAQGADAARKKLDTVEKKLKQRGSDFGAIAQSDSDDQVTAKKRGEIGWLPESQIRPEIVRAVVGLAKGGVSAPLHLDDGWHIVKLVDTKAAYTRPLSEVRPELIQQLRARRAMENRQAYLAKILQANPPAINEQGLSKALSQP